jgi:hypothetical protein
MPLGIAEQVSTMGQRCRFTPEGVMRSGLSSWPHSGKSGRLPAASCLAPIAAKEQGTAVARQEAPVVFRPQTGHSPVALGRRDWPCGESRGFGTDQGCRVLGRDAGTERNSGAGLSVADGCSPQRSSCRQTVARGALRFSSGVLSASVLNSRGAGYTTVFTGASCVDGCLIGFSCGALGLMVVSSAAVTFVGS